MLFKRFVSKFKFSNVAASEGNTSILAHSFNGLRQFSHQQVNRIGSTMHFLVEFGFIAFNLVLFLTILLNKG